MLKSSRICSLLYRTFLKKLRFYHFRNFLNDDYNQRRKIWFTFLSKRKQTLFVMNVIVVYLYQWFNSVHSIRFITCQNVYEWLLGKTCKMTYLQSSHFENGILPVGWWYIMHKNVLNFYFIVWSNLRSFVYMYKIESHLVKVCSQPISIHRSRNITRHYRNSDGNRD